MCGDEEGKVWTWDLEAVSCAAFTLSEGSSRRPPGGDLPPRTPLTPSRFLPPPRVLRSASPSRRTKRPSCGPHTTRRSSSL